MIFSDAQALVFDCDGVILNSNCVKTEAFRRVASQFGSQAAELLVGYHVRNGGVSRFRKFDYLLTTILGREAPAEEVEELSEQFGSIVFEELLTCQVTPGLDDLRRRTEGTPWMIVSGGAQEELRRVFAARGLDGYFDGGIYGSPDTKEDILMQHIETGVDARPALLLGDSRYDHEAAASLGLAFVFVYGWTEMADWQQYCSDCGLLAIPKVCDIAPYIGLG